MEVQYSNPKSHAPSYLPACVAKCLGWDEGEPLSNTHRRQYSESGDNPDDLVCIGTNDADVRGFSVEVKKHDDVVSLESDNETCMWNCFQSDQTRSHLLGNQDQQDSNLLCGMGDKLCWAGSKFCSAVKFVTQNKAETPPGRLLCSLVNITARQVLVSVFMQTTVRQIVARLFGELTENNPTIGWVMGVMPTVVVLTLNLWGHFRDLRSGKEVEALIKDFSDSVRDEVSRLNPDAEDPQINDFCAKLVQEVTDQLENHDAIQAAIYAKSDLRVSQEIDDHPEQDEAILLTSSPRNKLAKENPQLLEAIKSQAITLQNNLKNKTWPTSTVTFLRCASTIAIGTLSGAAAYTGVLPTIGATLSSFALYCVEREIAQVFFPCPDGLHKYYAKATGIAASCYIPNQFLVGFAMASLAGRSGQAAVGLSFMEALKNDLIRGCFNSLGEIVDLIILVLGQSVQNEVPFKVKLGFVKITNYEELMEAMAKLQNTFTALGAARLGIFQETILFSSLFFNFVEIDESVGEYGKKALVALVEAIYLGCRYSDLVARGGRVNWPYDSKLQSTSATQR